MLLQTDAKPLECEKTCTYIDSQRQRMVNHTGYKPYVCSVRNHSHRLDICKSMKCYIFEPWGPRKHSSYADTMHHFAASV